MGFFDALFGKQGPRNVETVPDQIWLTTRAKYRGLLQNAKQRAETDTVAILLVAHFPDVLVRLKEFADQPDWNVPCTAVLAHNLNSDLAATLQMEETEIIDIMVAERHPLPSVDESLKAFAAELPCRCRFTHHLSLDDPVMRVFAGEAVKQVLQQLGMSEDEPISSPMVSNRIQRAQQKIEGRSLGADEADSAQQWLEKNCPKLVRK